MKSGNFDDRKNLEFERLSKKDQNLFKNKK